MNVMSRACAILAHHDRCEGCQCVCHLDTITPMTPPPGPVGEAGLVEDTTTTAAASTTGALF